MAKKDSEYFNTFEIMAGLACRAAESLHTSLRDFDPDTLDDCRMALHAVEHEADMVRHEIMKKLAREFITPIERDDIIRLVNDLDDVVDKVEDVLIRIYMYNIRSIRPAALQFADVIERCCAAMKVAVAEFPNYHKSKTLHTAIIDVNTMEEEGDALYIRAVRELYVEGGNPVEVVAWSETFDCLEECCDACEDVANLLERVVMNNS